MKVNYFNVIKSLGLFIILFSNLLTASAQEVTESQSIDDIQNVFSEEYDRETSNLVENEIANRIITELDEYFGWGLTESDIEEEEVIKVTIPGFSEEDGNTIRITIEDNSDSSTDSFVDIELARRWESEEEFREFYTVFTKILDTELSGSEIEDSFTDYLKAESDFTVGKVEYFITDAEIYSDGKEWVAASRIFEDGLPLEEGGTNEDSSTSSGAAFNPDNYPYITDYESVVRDPNGKAGENINIYGTVVQVMEDSGITALRVATTNGYDDIYLVYMSTPDVRIIEDDILDVYGLSMGLESYEAVLGNTITVPSILATEVWIKGIDF